MLWSCFVLGRTVTDRQLRNKWLLVYFGFTNCPDICPEVLENLSDTVDNCSSVVKLQPVFITVDAYRDTPEKIDKYLKVGVQHLIMLKHGILFFFLAVNANVYNLMS